MNQHIPMRSGKYHCLDNVFTLQ